MTKIRRSSTYGLGLAACWLAIAAQAYPAYGYGPPPGYPPFPGGYAEPPGYSYGPTQARPSSGERLNITRDADANAYYLTIDTQGVDPKAVQVRIDGRSILVGMDRSKQDSVQQTFDEGRGYIRSYSLSRGQTNRRFTLPQDAETGAMQREDKDNQVRIVIPRRQQ